MTFLTMEQVNLHEKRVIIRVDLNVPIKNGEILDDTRIQAILPTLRKALAEKARILLLSHLGRPKEGEEDPALSLKPIATRLEQLLNYPIRFEKQWLTGLNINPSEIVLAENLRFNAGEEENNPILARQMAELCDVFIMDAFGTAHRSHASTVGIAQFAPVAVAGPLLAIELAALSTVLQAPKRPLLAIVSGAKISGKLELLKSLLKYVDVLIVGGGIANTFIAAQGFSVGSSLIEPDLIPVAKSLIEYARQKNVALVIPEDGVLTTELSNTAKTEIKTFEAIGNLEKIVDIGPRSIHRYQEIIKEAGTILWNGPLGVFEYQPFEEGTKMIAKAIAASSAFTIVGGGETLAAIKKYQVAEKISYVSTGGGAFLEYIEGKKLPGVAILEDRRMSSPKTSCNDTAAVKPRRTKIIATLGPSTDKPGVLEKIIREGVNLVRVNLSHGLQSDHITRIQAVREYASKLNREVGILIDLQGPKIRIARFREGLIDLKADSVFILDAALGVDEGTEHSVGIDYKNLPKDVVQGDILLLDDGLIVLEVTEVKGNIIKCIVKLGGRLSNNKGINRKGGGLTAESLTQKDRDDIIFAARIEADYVAISFPRSAEDIKKTRELLKAAGSEAGVIAKIERVEAVRDMDDIIKSADAVMVARGDLGVEIGYAELPAVQKEIIARARALDRAVITATQMMESMINHPIPTRAEVSDVANAVLDGTDAVMLSAETATGEYPDKVIAVMSEICLAAERQRITQISNHRLECQFQKPDEAIAMAAMYTANHINTTAIVALAETGSTPLWMSRIRSSIPIYGLSRNKYARGRMTLYRGVYPIDFDATQYPEAQVIQEVLAKLVQLNLISKGKRILMTTEDIMGNSGDAHTLKIITV